MCNHSCSVFIVSIFCYSDKGEAAPVGNWETLELPELDRWFWEVMKFGCFDPDHNEEEMKEKVRVRVMRYFLPSLD